MPAVGDRRRGVGSAFIGLPVGGDLAAAARLGLDGLFRGAGARLLQMTLIVVVQLLANDGIRGLCGLPAMGIAK